MIVPMTFELKRFLDNPDVQKHFKDGLFRPCKDASVNRQLARIEDRLSLERHSFHSLRRLIATQKYNNLRSMGVPKAVALSIVSLSLNHGEKGILCWLILISMIVGKENSYMKILDRCVRIKKNKIVEVADSFYDYY